MTTPPFDRTVCVCTRCVACCAHPAPLIPDDLVRIARFRDQAIEDLLDDLQPGRGALIANRTTGRLLRIPTLIPRTRHGRCVFLEDGARCAIHPVSPFGCAYFDVHLDTAEANRRSLWGHRLMLDPTFQGLIHRLTTRLAA